MCQVSSYVSLQICWFGECLMEVGGGFEKNLHMMNDTLTDLTYIQAVEHG